MATNMSEVALDFKDALEDLKANARFEINNLTVIAKENTEHAQAISEVLENHIRETRPEWKLPALYVLDSIVKNVGTPYTVYLGRNLYRIFMDTYSLVDPTTRKAMGNLFKTWKDPVPDSLDTRPVFPPQVTREIENALLKHRTLIIQSRPTTANSGPSQPGWSQSAAASSQGGPTPSQTTTTTTTATTAATHHAPSTQPTQPTPPSVPAPNAPAGPGAALASHASTTRLREKLMELIYTASMNQHDSNTKQLLETLVQLRGMIESSSLTVDQLAMAETEVERIRAVVIPKTAPVPTRPAAASQYLPPPTGPSRFRQTSPFAPGGHSRAGSGTRDFGAQPRPSVGPNDPTDLAVLFRSIGSYIQPVSGGVGVYGGVPEMLAALRQAGFSTFGGEIFGAADVYRRPTDVVLDMAILKRPRPDLVSILYDTKPDICKECGRRFEATTSGKELKAKHLDWHFHVNTKLADQTNLVVSRSWLLDEMAWVKHEGHDLALGGSLDGPAAGSENGEEKPGGKGSYVLVPTDLEKVDARCPICQENFKVEWHNEEEQLVWVDAATVDGQTYHVSCYF